MSEGLPVYKLQIDASVESDLQVDFVSLVDAPAIQKDFIAFEERIKFAVNEDRHIISGPAMLADVPIYRRDEQMGEYMVVFDSPTIFQIAQKFFAKGFNQNLNLMHEPQTKVEGVCIFESFIVDSSRGIKPMAGFEDAKEGSWFISAHITNPSVWQVIKDGKVKGFSVEGVFSYAKNKMHKYSDEQLVEALKQIFKS